MSAATAASFTLELNPKKPRKKTSLKLPLVTNDGVSFYSYNPYGQPTVNKQAAIALVKKLREIGNSHGGYLNDFDDIIVPAYKPFSMAERMIEELGLSRISTFVPILKEKKGYMKNPTKVSVKSITTNKRQAFWLGEDDINRLKGKRVLVIEDVVSTGGTLDALFALAKKVGFTITVIACLFTEGDAEADKQSYNDVPIIKVGHVPLPQIS